jgi:hypothetical protein
VRSGKQFRSSTRDCSRLLQRSMTQSKSPYYPSKTSGSMAQQAACCSVHRCPKGHRAESNPAPRPLRRTANCRFSKFKCWRLGWVAFTLLMNRHESERGRCDSSARLLLCHRVRLRATGRPPGTYLANPLVLCTSGRQSARNRLVFRGSAVHPEQLLADASAFERSRPRGGRYACR